MLKATQRIHGHVGIKTKASQFPLWSPLSWSLEEVRSRAGNCFSDQLASTLTYVPARTFASVDPHLWPPSGMMGSLSLDLFLMELDPCSLILCSFLYFSVAYPGLPQTLLHTNPVTTFLLLLN